MENITFNELLSIIEDKGLNMTWCNHDNWTVNRALGYIEGLLKLCPSDQYFGKFLPINKNKTIESVLAGSKLH